MRGDRDDRARRDRPEFGSSAPMHCCWKEGRPVPADKWFTWSVHFDGSRQEHDVVGLPDRRLRRCAAVAAVKARGFRTVINCTLFDNAKPERVAAFFDDVMAMGLDGILSRATRTARARPAAFPQSPQDGGAVPRRLRRQARRSGQFEPVIHVPGLPGRQSNSIAPRRRSTRTYSAGSGPAICSARAIQDVQAADGRDRLDGYRHRRL